MQNPFASRQDDADSYPGSDENDDIPPPLKLNHIFPPKQNQDIEEMTPNQIILEQGDIVIREPEIKDQEPNLEGIDTEKQPFKNIQDNEIGGRNDQVPRSKCYNIWFALLLTSMAYDQGYYITVYAKMGLSWLELEHNVTTQGEGSQILGNINLQWCLGAALGSFCGVWCTEMAGRKRLAIWIEVVRIGIVGIYMINNVNVLYVNRFQCGITIGIINTLCPMYIGECLPLNLRAFGGIFWYGLRIFGDVTTSMIGVIMSANMMAEYWRYMLGYPVIWNLLRIVFLMYYNIESPQYFLTKHATRLDMTEITKLRMINEAKNSKRNSQFIAKRESTRALENQQKLNPDSNQPFNSQLFTDNNGVKGNSKFYYQAHENQGNDGTLLAPSSNQIAIKNEYEVEMSRNRSKSESHIKKNLGKDLVEDKEVMVLETNENKIKESPFEMIGNGPVDNEQEKQIQLMVDAMSEKDLELTFREEYEFDLAPEYMAIMHRDLKKFYTQESSEKVLEGILLEHKRKQMQPKVFIRDMFRPLYRKRLFLGVMQSVWQQLSGINFFIFYAVKVFDEINGTGQVVNVCMAWINFWAWVPSLYLGTKFGRKFNFLLGISGQGFSQLIMSIMIYSVYYTILYLPTMTFVFFFSIGMGGTCFLFVSEILPPAGAGLCFTMQWLTSGLVAKVGPLASDAYGPENVCLFFLLMCTLAFIFMVLLFRETKGKTLREIEEDYIGLKCIVCK